MLFCIRFVGYLMKLSQWTLVGLLSTVLVCSNTGTLIAIIAGTAHELGSDPAPKTLITSYFSNLYLFMSVYLCILARPTQTLLLSVLIYRLLNFCPNIVIWKFRLCTGWQGGYRQTFTLADLRVETYGSSLGISQLAPKEIDSNPYHFICIRGFYHKPMCSARLYCSRFPNPLPATMTSIWKIIWNEDET